MPLVEFVLNTAIHGGYLLFAASGQKSSVDFLKNIDIHVWKSVLNQGVFTWGNLERTQLYKKVDICASERESVIAQRILVCSSYI